MEVKQGYDYDDVLIVPKQSSLNSRNDVKMNSKWFGLYPIISSPMKGISGPDLVIEMGKLNCLGILHRFDTYDWRYESVDKIVNHPYNFGVSIGLNNWEDELKFVDYAIESGCSLICVDVANGYLDRLISSVKHLRSIFPDVAIMAGNVATYGGASNLYSAGCDFIRVGIGGGALCSTRNVTGIGVPQLTAIEDCSKVNFSVESTYETGGRFYYDWSYSVNAGYNILPLNKYIYDHKVNIVSDGGVRNSGNAVKSFACGADFVMLGSILAYANEAENNGSIRGMASRTIQEEFHTDVKSVEGIEMEVQGDKKPLADIIREFLYGIKSACTYLDADHYSKIREKASFVSTGKGTLKNL